MPRLVSTELVQILRFPRKDGKVCETRETLKRYSDGSSTTIITRSAYR